jgi:hypothetical protein
VAWPLACSNRSGGQFSVLLVRHVAHASTIGDMPVWRMMILPATSPLSRRSQQSALPVKSGA